MFLIKKIKYKKNQSDASVFFLNNIFQKIFIKKKYKNKIRFVKIFLKKNKLVFKIINLDPKITKINFTLVFYYFNYVTLLEKNYIKIIVGKNLDLFINEEYYLKNNNLFFNFNKLFLIILEKSKVTYLKFKNIGISNINMIIINQKKSHFFLYDLNLFEKNSINYIFVKNLSNNCINYINGIYILGGHQYLKNKIKVINKFNNGKNIQDFIGIYSGKSTIRLKGDIYIKKKTINNISTQNYKNYILSKKVNINVKPYLNIYTSNVVCSHGVNLGIIDKNFINYLLTRGINPLKAKILFFLSILYKNINNVVLNKKISKSIISKIKKCLIKK